MPPLTNRAQTTRAILLAKATVTSIFGLRASICASQDPAGAPRRGLPDHRAGPEDQQAANGPLSSFRDGAELLLSASRFLEWRQPQPSGEIASGSEAPGRRHKCRDCGGSNRTYARDRHQSPRDRVCRRAPVDFTIQLLDLRFQCSEGVDRALSRGSRVSAIGPFDALLTGERTLRSRRYHDHRRAGYACRLYDPVTPVPHYDCLAGVGG